MIPIRTIEILWSESPRLTAQVFETFRASASALRLAASGAPQGGAYHKTMFRLTWNDGQTYEGRLDLTRDHQRSDNPIGEHVRSFCEFTSGRKCPGYMTPERYQEYFNATAARFPEVARECAAVLDGYALDDRLCFVVDAPPTPAFNPAALTAEEWAALDETDADRTARETAEKRKKRGEGAKYDATRSLADIKRGVQCDIIKAVTAGELPRATYKVSAKKSRGSRPHVDVEVSGLPFPVTHPEKLAVLRRDGNDNRHRGPWKSPEAEKVYDTIQGIVDTYGYDRSDAMTDYFDCAFYSNVSFANREYEEAVAEYEAGRQAVRS